MNNTQRDNATILALAAGTALWVALGGYGLIAYVAQLVMTGTVEAVIAIGRTFIIMGP